MCNYGKIEKIISDMGLKVLLNEPMTKHTTFKIGGNADIFIYVNNAEELSEIIKTLNSNNIPYFMVGNGSNLLISDFGIEGAVIKLDGDFKNIKLINEDTIECGAGVSLSKLCIFAQKNSLSGLEFAYGIPGTVGGAVYMNAGAYGGEIKDVIVSANSITTTGQNNYIEKDLMDLSYRHSIYENNGDTIVSARFKLKKSDPLHIKEKMGEYMSRRKEKQPLEYPSAGSVFKRPIGNYAGTLIQTCGLKGKAIGDAMVSTKHAGFIVNKSNASCQNVIDLIDHIKAVVLENTGIALECEIKAIGKNIT